MKIENIKFKAKELGTGKWKEGFLQRDMDYNLCILIAKKEEHSWYWTQINQSTVRQFTGLKDCKDNEIWEGDIIKGPYLGKERTIEWNNHLCSFTALNEINSSDKPLGALVRSLGWYVIGNKFDKEK